MRRCVAAALCALLAACAAPVQPSPGLNPPSQPDSAAAADATLTLTASGQVACSIPYGCSALLLIQPNSAGASPSPVWTLTTGEPISFPLIGACAMGTWDVGALPMNAPGTIAPGRYHVAGVIKGDGNRVDLSCGRIDISGRGRRCSGRHPSLARRVIADRSAANEWPAAPRFFRNINPRNGMEEVGPNSGPVTGRRS
jgi:hypothetical protein